MVVKLCIIVTKSWNRIWPAKKNAQIPLFEVHRFLHSAVLLPRVDLVNISDSQTDMSPLNTSIHCLLKIGHELGGYPRGIPPWTTHYLGPSKMSQFLHLKTPRVFPSLSAKSCSQGLSLPVGAPFAVPRALLRDLTFP